MRKKRQRWALAFLEAVLSLAAAVFGICFGEFLWSQLGWNILLLIGGISVLAVFYYFIERDKDDK